MFCYGEKSQQSSSHPFGLDLRNAAILAMSNYRVSLKIGTLVILCLISVLGVGFYFFTCILESEF